MATRITTYNYLLESSSLTFHCPACKSKMVLKSQGGQFQNTWKGTCPRCTVNWILDCEQWMEEYENEEQN